MSSAPTECRKFLTTREVAEELGVSNDHVRKLASEGVLTGTRFRPSGFWRFPAEGVQAFVEWAAKAGR
jgi:excisionase family DNA binding protein